MSGFSPPEDDREAIGLKLGSGQKTMLSVAIEWVKWMQFVPTRKLQIRVKHDLVVFYKISIHLVISGC